MKGLLRINKNSRKLTDLLIELEWPNSPVLVIAQLILQALPWCQKVTEESGGDHHGHIHKSSQQAIGKIKVSISAIRAFQKPRIIAFTLSISRELVYSLRRELRRKARASMSFIQNAPSNHKLRKAIALEIISEFSRGNIHKFYTASDVKHKLESSSMPNWTLSLPTIRRWMNQDLGLSFKKVNIRYKKGWTPDDIIIKLKFLWIFCWLVNEGYHLIYTDQFHIQDSTIKTYNWSTRGKQNYWFGDKKDNKLNWVVAISEYGPQNINIQDNSMNTDAFSSFIQETIKKIRQDEVNPNSKICLVFDNAGINVAKKVDERIFKWNWWAITIPPYTPEWNSSEIVINLIKQKLDRDLKQHR